MVNLLQLKKFSEQTNNKSALYIINAYIKTTEESWTKGKNYFGGQVPLDLTEDISDNYLNLVQQKNNSAISQGACNSWENMSMQKSFHEFDILKTLIDSHTRQLRINGLLRALVFWIVPARKRAAEKVFHPSNMTKYFNESEKEYNSYISYRNDIRKEAVSGIL